ncbi:hypothetical protein K1T71_009303 [Dendrolimus kikuchii]|uniref:Uncharacterized protein n=1 Tax=Dendrolimus kikuchii TaxID=765133 RepID=A0ACC1CVQ3_9NEOP|nr:hypothetical protein K1T71_009303 [Dendrolimus kikuchii]
MKNYTYLKNYCNKIFFVGTGNFWFEENSKDDKSLLYRMYSTILFFTYGLMTILEIMAAVIGDFPEDEKRDSVSFAVSHTIVMIKILSVMLNKDLIKSLNQKMVSLCQCYEEELLMEEKYRIIKINVVAYFVTVYGSAACFVFEGLRKVGNGFHFVTVVTYYPSFDDDTILATVFRIFTSLVLFMLMMTMIVSIDFLTLSHLILYKYKFITLRHYFQNLKDDFDRINIAGEPQKAAERLEKGLIEGIVMHGELIRLSKEIDKAFGTVMALQLFQSSGSAVSLLLQIALSDELTFVASMKIIFFVVALFFLLGLFLCNAGEITYQASLVSDEIFYCGWYACRPRLPNGRSVRKLVLLAIMQARRPLVMKAFKMLELTYATFLLVVRGTYSVFALFYAQGK